MESRESQETPTTTIRTSDTTILKEVQDNLLKLTTPLSDNEKDIDVLDEEDGEDTDESLCDCPTNVKIGPGLTTDLKNAEKASTIAQSHTENLDEIFQQITQHQQQRRFEYEKLLKQLSDYNLRTGTIQNDNLDHLKTQISQIRADYQTVETELKEVQNELNVLRHRFDKISTSSNEDESCTDGTSGISHHTTELIKMLDDEQNKFMIDTTNNNEYSPNRVQLNSILAEVAKLSKDSDEFEKYVKTLETGFNKKIN